jgi:hypothetical protein
VSDIAGAARRSIRKANGDVPIKRMKLCVVFYMPAPIRRRFVLASKEASLICDIGPKSGSAKVPENAARRTVPRTGADTGIPAVVACQPKAVQND